MSYSVTLSLPLTALKAFLSKDKFPQSFLHYITNIGAKKKKLLRNAARFAKGLKCG